MNDEETWKFDGVQQRLGASATTRSSFLGRRRGYEWDGRGVMPLELRRTTREQRGEEGCTNGRMAFEGLAGLGPRSFLVIPCHTSMCRILHGAPREKNGCSRGRL